MNLDFLVTCFKAYDIRGRVPDELTYELARQVGLAFAAEFAAKNVCIGYDIRPSSLNLAKVLANGLEDGGADVVNIGLCGTEEIYHATFHGGFDGGIMITASHNPADWNGMKLVRKGAVPISADSGLNAIRDRILTGNLPIARMRGNTSRQNFRSAYVEHILSHLGAKGITDLAALNIVANAGNGCAFLPVKELAKHLPFNIIALNAEPDGSFPNGVPNPLLPEKRQETSLAVLKHKADMGIAWDGDFDRCFFFDENGSFVESYYIVGLLAEDLLAKHPGERIIHDSRLTWNTIDMVRTAGGIPIESKTGHAFMKESMRRENAIYGGEMSGHHFFRDFAFCDSGMIVWLLICRLMSRSRKKLSELVAERMQLFPVSGEINREVADPDAILLKVEAQYTQAGGKPGFIDGLSMEFADWRFNMRKSNTEALLRLNVESRADKELMCRKRDELLALMV